MKVAKLDMKSPNFRQELYESLANTGFAVLTNHGLSKERLDHVYGQWANFFGGEAKHALKAEHGGAAGYFPMKSENAKGYSVKDLKEFYHIFGEFFDEKLPEGIDKETSLLAEDLEFLGMKLLSDINLEYAMRHNENLGLPSMVHLSKNTLFRVLHYPPLPSDMEEGAVRAAAHEDINLITILPAATAPGLQVKDSEGKWHTVDVDPGTVVVNVGDMLQEATGGKLVSTTHQVINPSGDDAKKSRYSSPLFVHPHPEVRLSERYTAGEYLEQRLREIGLIK